MPSGLTTFPTPYTIIVNVCAYVLNLAALVVNCGVLVVKHLAADLGSVS